MMLRTVWVGVLVGVLLSFGAAPAGAGSAEHGRLWRDDGVLRKGCHDYTYRYKVKPPTRDWAIETFLRDPRGETIASGGFISDVDPKRGKGSFRFCRYNTTAGTFKIRGKLTYTDGYDQKVVWVKPGFFKLRRR